VIGEDPHGSSPISLVVLGPIRPSVFIVQTELICFVLNTSSVSQGCKSGIRPLVWSPRKTPCSVPSKGYWILKNKVYKLHTSRITLETLQTSSISARRERDCVRRSTMRTGF
jgi:hypothetical protein